MCREVSASSRKVLACKPSRFDTANSELGVHEDIAQRARRMIADAIVIRHATFDKDYLLHFLNARQFVGGGEILNRELPIPGSRTAAILTENNMTLSAESVIVTMQWLSVWESFECYTYVANDIISGRSAKVLTGDPVVWGVAKVATGLAPKHGCDSSGDNLSRQIIGDSRFMSVPNDSAESENIYDEFPELQLLEKPSAIRWLLLWLTLTSIGLWLIKFEV
jgi:hypothetical protein